MSVSPNRLLVSSSTATATTAVASAMPLDPTDIPKCCHRQVLLLLPRSAIVTAAVNMYCCHCHRIEVLLGWRAAKDKLQRMILNAVI
jgi:hypothetical protein